MNLSRFKMYGEETDMGVLIPPFPNSTWVSDLVSEG